MGSISNIRETSTKVKAVMSEKPKKRAKRLELYSNDLNQKMLDIEFALNGLILGFKIIHHNKEKNQDSFLQATELLDSFINDCRELKL